MAEQYTEVKGVVEGMPRVWPILPSKLTYDLTLSAKGGSYDQLGSAGAGDLETDAATGCPNWVLFQTEFDKL